MSERPFRVIIVGAGPTGLYLANALSKANIDFVVLEQHHTIVTHAGAGIIVWAHSTRLLDQLGLFSEAKNLHAHIDRKIDLLLNGKVLRETSFFGTLEQCFGYPTIAASRSELIQVLYEGIPDRVNRVKTSAQIVDIETDSEGVRVHLKDGTVEEGSIVIGVDGVHSKTRETMQRLSNSPVEQHPMTATFYGIYGKSTHIEGFEEGVFYESRGTGMVTQFFRTGDKLHYAILKTLETPTAERRTYSAEEAEQMAEEFAGVFVSPAVTFKEVWAATDKATARLVNQEEGFTEKWHHGRIALVGDSAHKMTSITGQGVNCAMHSAATLANELRSTLLAHPHPTTELLEETFARYQKTRQEESRRLVDVSSMATRLVTWSSWRAWFWDRFIAYWVEGRMFVGRFQMLISSGQILDYVPFTEQKGTVPWLRKVLTQS